MEQFPDFSKTQLRDDAAAFGVIGQPLHLIHDLRHQPSSDVRDALPSVPGTHFLQVGECRFGKFNGLDWHDSSQTETLLRVGQRDRSPFLDIHKSLDDGFEKSPLLGLGFVILN